MDEAKLLRKKIKNGAVKVKDKDTPKKPRDEWYSHCTKCWGKFKTKTEEKIHHDSKTCKWRLSRPDDPYYEEFKGLPSRINRINAYVKIKNIQTRLGALEIAGLKGITGKCGQFECDVKFCHCGKCDKLKCNDEAHISPHLTNTTTRATINDLVEQQNLDEDDDRVINFGLRRSSISSDDTKSIDDRDNMVERDERLPLKIESEMSRRNLMNKRKIKCNVCYNVKFPSTYLLKRHVATEHMKLGRWSCTICDFHIWSHDECLHHAKDNHRLRGTDNGIVERPLDEYFKEYLDRREAGERLETQNGIANTADSPEDENNGKVGKDFMMMEDGSMVVGEAQASGSSLFDNCNGDDDGEVSFTVKDISADGEPRKRKRSSSEESLTASENSSAKQSRSGTTSPVLDETPTTPSKNLSGNVISSLMNQSRVPNLDESQKEDSKESMSLSPVCVADSRSSDINGSPHKSNGL